MTQSYGVLLFGTPCINLTQYCFLIWTLHPIHIENKNEGQNDNKEYTSFFSTPISKALTFYCPCLIPLAALKD